MRTSSHIRRESGRVTRRTSTNAVLKSEVYLNTAFDGLNRCQMRKQSVPSELANIIADAVSAGVEIYKQARRLHASGQYSHSAKYAKTISEFCNLVNSIAEDNSENLLGLPLPPKMQQIKAIKSTPAKNLHPLVSGLEPFIRKRLVQSSKFYRSRLSGYSKIITGVSNLLDQIETFH